MMDGRMHRTRGNYGDGSRGPPMPHPQSRPPHAPHPPPHHHDHHHSNNPHHQQPPSQQQQLHHHYHPSPPQHHQHRHHGRSPHITAATTPTPALASKSQECHICLEDLRQDLVACPCGHVFHEECILQALEVNSQCPICRRFAQGTHLIRLFLDLPDAPGATVTASSEPGSASGTRGGAHNAIADAQIPELHDRIALLIERLQWQKKQYDLLDAEMKRHRHQGEQLLVDKQTLLQRIGALEASKNELLTKVSKYQLELSRQAELTRQMNVNQSIINYLNTCDGEAIEEEIQNPRELIVALKKACKFRHDQYQKVVKEKMRLKALVQSLQQNNETSNTTPLASDGDERSGKGKMKGRLESKRAYVNDYSGGASMENKKRKIIYPASGTVTPPGSSLSAAAPASLANSYLPRADNSSTFRASAYTDVAVRPVTAGMSRSQASFSRSNYNPSQYGSYNLVPSADPPVQPSDHAVCRRGYDETGKLTNYFIPKEPKRSVQSVQQPSKPMPSMQHLLGMPTRMNSSGPPPGIQPTASSRSASRERGRDYALTSWLRNGQ